MEEVGNDEETCYRRPEAGRHAEAPYLSQSDVPGVSLENALRVPRLIGEKPRPVTPLEVAAALEMSPSSGPFRSLCGASIAYGLTNGGCNAQSISLTALGKRIVKPLEEGDNVLAKREAVMRPRVVGEFLTKYSGLSLPRLDIAMNVLQDMGVPKEKAKSVFSLIVDGAQAVGLLREIKGRQYVDLTGVPQEQKVGESDDEVGGDDEGGPERKEGESQTNTNARTPSRQWEARGECSSRAERTRPFLTR